MSSSMWGVDVTDDEDDDVIITEDNPENAESKEEENPERRDESTQDIINELEALPDEVFDAFPDELFLPGGGDGDGSPSSPTSQRHPEEDEAGCWELKDDLVIRHHFTPRKQFFNPKDAELSLPIELNRLSSTRWTFMEYLDKEEKDTEIDESKEKPSTEGRDRVWGWNYGIPCHPNR